MTAIRTYYLVEGGNWGDILTPFLFSKLYNINLIRCTRTEKFDLVSTGSLLRDLPNPWHDDCELRTGAYTGDVLGTALMDWEHDELFDLSQAKVHLLRGKLTRANCKLSSDPLLGDPGILAHLFVKPTKTEFDLGVIPHYVEKDNEQIALWRERGANIIDVQAGIQNVIDETCKCKKIVSSSLHGLVLADALDIPNHIVVLHDWRVWQRGFKFNDYYSVYDEEAHPVWSIKEAVDLCRTRDTTAVKKAVKQAFDKFAESVGGGEDGCSC